MKMNLDEAIGKLERWLVDNIRFTAFIEKSDRDKTWQCMLFDNQGTGENYTGFGQTLPAAINNAIDAHQRNLPINTTRRTS